MERIVTISSITIDLERLRSIKLNNYSELGETNILTIEYNSRLEYLQNPFTNEIEQTIIVDTITKEYPDFETAKAYQFEIQEIWNEYLQNK
ncbi:MAG: hypothetical protein WCG87_01605 [Bacteroidota bacterium]